MLSAYAAFGPAIARLPDGETGARAKFIGWQAALLAQSPMFELTPLGPSSQWGPNGELPPRILKLKPGARGTPLFPPTGYAEEALASYAVLARLKRERRIPREIRLQVALPTPMGVLAAYMEPDGQRIAEPPYRERFIADVARITAGIPHDELTIQWDVPQEIAVWEGACDTYLARPRIEIVAMLAALMESVPEAVELGLHLCYGDIGHKHWKEPNLAVMVEFANAVAAGVHRRIDYVHMPIPRHWQQASHYSALRQFSVPSELFLGLVHATDGLDGAKRRIEAASPFRAEFGVAASCGLGRRKREDIPRLLELHRMVAEAA